MADENVTPGGIADEGGADDTLKDDGGIADEPKEETGGIADEGDQSNGDDEPAKDEGGKEKDGGKQQEPEAYELTAPEDFPLPAENLDSFTAKARELGLTKEQAEGMLAWHREFHGDVTKAMQQRESAVLQGWAKEIRGDKEFGGDNWKETLADSRRALAAFDPDGSLRALLRDSKYQNNPTIIRAVARIGRAMKEHDFVGQNGAGKSRDIPLEERMYPDMKV